MNNNTQESKIQLEYINKCTELVKEKYENAPAFFIQNAGCQMNSLQTDTVAGIVKRMGYTEVSREEDADVVIYNTCTVRENANLKIYGHLGHLKSIKKKNPELKIILFGCMMQEPEVIEKIHKEYSFVDLVFGTHNFHKFPELFYRSLNTEGQIIDVWKESDEIVEGMPSDRKYSFKTGVNIMFGCNNFCSYCIVPYVRGRERSRDPKAIVREIERLVAAGVGEVIAQIVEKVVPKGNVNIGIIVYAVGMVLFTMIMGNAYAAITVMTVGIGYPFVLAHGANPVVIGMLALTCGFCGTLCTPMAANFNTVPVALLDMKKPMGVIKNQVPVAIIMMVVQIVMMILLK